MATPATRCWPAGPASRAGGRLLIETTPHRRAARGRRANCDKACFTLSGISERGLLQAVHTAVALDAEGSYPEAPVPDYADETVSTKVVRSFRAILAWWIRWCGASKDSHETHNSGGV